MNAEQGSGFCSTRRDGIRWANFNRLIGIRMQDSAEVRRFQSNLASAALEVLEGEDPEEVAADRSRRLSYQRTLPIKTRQQSSETDPAEIVNREGLNRMADEMSKVFENKGIFHRPRIILKRK